MKSRFYATLFICGWLSVTPGIGQSDDLLHAWQLALRNDPALLSARYLPKIARQNRLRAVANMLPSITANYTYEENEYQRPTAIGQGGGPSSIDAETLGAFLPNSSGHTTSKKYSVDVQQVLFDFRSFTAFSELARGQTIADKQLEITKFDTTLRVIHSYFQQLVRHADLKLARAELEALSIQLTAARLRLELGSDSKISVQQIQARYDQARAAAIVAENNHRQARDQLWLITLHRFENLKSAREKPPTHLYQPNQLDHWLKQALIRNPQIEQATATTEQANYTRRRVNGSFWPRLSASYQFSNTDIGGNDPFASNFSGGDNSRVSLNVVFPLFTGGDNIAQSRIAAYRFQSSRENEQLVRRQVENEVTQLWDNHRALYAILEAREAALLSSAGSLELVRQGKLLGNNSTSDVLQSVSDHYQAQRDFIVAIYDYLYNQARFEAATGTLGGSTVERINSYLVP